MNLPMNVSRLDMAQVSDVSKAFVPTLVMDIELTEPLPTLNYDNYHRRVRVLARLHSEPIGWCVLEIDQNGLTSDQLGELLWSTLRERVAERFAAIGITEPNMLTGKGLKVG